MEIQSNFKNQLQPINLGAGNKYLNLTDGTLDKWIPGNRKSLLMHSASYPCTQCMQGSRYSSFTLNMDLDSLLLPSSSNTQLLSPKYQIVGDVWVALCHYGHCLTIDNSITVHDTLPWNEFGIFRKEKSYISFITKPWKKIYANRLSEYFLSLQKFNFSSSITESDIKLSLFFW